MGTHNRHCKSKFLRLAISPRPLLMLQAGTVEEYTITELLDYETAYYIRARYQDSNGTWSGWSETNSFTTETANTNIVGVALRATGGSGGTWEHIDADGNTISTPLCIMVQFTSCLGGTSRTSQLTVKPWYRFQSFTIEGVRLQTGMMPIGYPIRKNTGFTVMPAFVLDGVEVDEFQVGKYQASESGGLLQSVSGVLPKVSTNLADFISYADAPQHWRCRRL